jgi:hypothetical protein
MSNKKRFIPEDTNLYEHYRKFQSIGIVGKFRGTLLSAE